MNVRRHVRSKWAVISLVAMLMIAGLSATSTADLRIISKAEGERTELLVKGSRVVSPTGEGNWMMIDCDLGLVTVVGGREYWQGSTSDLARALDVAIQEQMTSAQEVPGLGSLLGGLFGSSAKQPAPIEVRITEIGTGTVAGYDSVHHRIETRQGGNWKRYEDVWVSAALMGELKSEIGDCLASVTELHQQFASLVPFGLDEMMAVLTSPDYLELVDTGYPVRTVTTMSIFGMAIEVETEVIEVNRNPIDEAFFTVPANYRLVADPSVLFGM